MNRVHQFIYVSSAKYAEIKKNSGAYKGETNLTCPSLFFALTDPQWCEGGLNLKNENAFHVDIIFLSDS